MENESKKTNKNLRGVAKFWELIGNQSKRPETKATPVLKQQQTTNNTQLMRSKNSLLAAEIMIAPLTAN